MSSISVAAFYRFAAIADPEGLRARLYEICRAFSAKGILLVASEGINGTIATNAQRMADLLETIREATGFHDLRPRLSQDEVMPFLRLKVRLKKEIVTLGRAEADPLKQVGTYVPPSEWNALISDPNTIVVDTRNDYEFRLGTFDHALDPATPTFRDFPDYVEKNLVAHKERPIAMFCTGGIRCEKATSYLVAEGFKKVFHLEGGILNYLETIPEEQSLWRGGCFVFDRRVALGHGLKPLPMRLCYGCLAPLDEDDFSSPDYEEGVSCPHCAPLLTKDKRKSLRERHRQTLLAQKHGRSHLGPFLHDESDE